MPTTLTDFPRLKIVYDKPHSNGTPGYKDRYPRRVWQLVKVVVSDTSPARDEIPPETEVLVHVWGDVWHCLAKRRQ